MLTVDNLSAVRDENELFHQLSFELQSGQIMQIEGRNGSGKTTLLRIIAGLGNHFQGKVCWNGESIEEQRESYYQDMLYLGHLAGVKRELTALENLQFYLSLHGGDNQRDTLYKVLSQVGLAGREDVPVAQLSAGQQRRVALARLWLSDHSLWILDEPLTAIDKQGVKVLESLFIRHAQQGGMVLLTTHQDMLTEHPLLRTVRLGDKA
ncbi:MULTISPECIES: cytochrome c biogenesis heme-transporting ATPase CcmA [Vibrio]|uniref:Cytochrome c biogenesis heme-transporting ATPase CcmA n=2 Tax=Vibrio TaxID=662 RepID=A0A7X4LHP7_9VIBR|nr:MULTISPECIES: cytochrome c biogenesis heme-transporting ATPase CcmA [Vibrio]MBF8999557.1 cytochrome c biogenesis heme-transporting ATPase CcmA [Vibrio nitrifigilis]MZI92129.1 cytochrome c biogenesis heme-transporting ATPase CcmA [Vibrio eleionomae]